MNIETTLVHPPRIEGEPTSSVSTPIYQTATFQQDLENQTTQTGRRFDYSRSANPTRDVLERQLANLDGASRALAFSSGMSAIASVLRLLHAGSEVIVGTDLYGGSNRLLEDLASRGYITVRHVDTSDVEATAAAVSERTGLVLLESPTNPRLRVADIRGIAEAAKRKKPGVLIAVDNSALSPLVQKPLELGADIAIQSATKLLGGHSDLTAGVVATRDEALAARIAFIQNADGTALAPFDSWLLLRGLETLALRLEKQTGNAQRLAAWLTSHRLVNRVHYPGSDAHPGHAVHARQARAGGVLLSFETGDAALSRRVIANAALFRTVVSFGSVSSSISLPSAMSHASIPAAERAKRELPDDLVRVSAGIEHIDDLIADLDQAFKRAHAH